MEYGDRVEFSEGSRTDAGLDTRTAALARTRRDAVGGFVEWYTSSSDSRFTRS
jgi:hypothetical protein